MRVGAIEEDLELFRECLEVGEEMPLVHASGSEFSEFSVMWLISWEEESALVLAAPAAGAVEGLRRGASVAVSLLEVRLAMRMRLGGILALNPLSGDMAEGLRPPRMESSAKLESSSASMSSECSKRETTLVPSCRCTSSEDAETAVWPWSTRFSRHRAM